MPTVLFIQAYLTTFKYFSPKLKINAHTSNTCVDHPCAVVVPQNVHIARFLLVATPARRKRPRDRFKRTEKRAGIDLERRRRFRRPTSTGFPGDLFCHFAARSSVDVEPSVENLRTSKQQQPPKRSGAEEYRRRERRRPRKTFSIIRSS